MTWRWVAAPLLLLFGAALVWMAGFDAFERSARARPVDPPAADGIVVLTGGAERIEAGLVLLAAGKAPRLLVSGVGPGSDMTEITHRLPVPTALLATHGITLGRVATDTVGNAAETAAWARRNDLHTLIVVTAGYHMPRALREIARELPDVTLYAVPIRSPALRSADRVAAVRLLAVEYDKFLAAWLGLNRWFGRGAR